MWLWGRREDPLRRCKDKRRDDLSRCGCYTNGTECWTLLVRVMELVDFSHIDAIYMRIIINIQNLISGLESLTSLVRSAPEFTHLCT